MDQNKFKTKQRLRRKKRVRKKISGTAECPRLTLSRSLRHMYAQLIDDTSGVTLVASSSLKDGKGGNIETAKVVGKTLAEKALELGITQVHFDRNGYKYHGRVQALADSAREAGLKF